MDRRPGYPHASEMKKRALAAVLWFFAGWYFGAFLAEIFGVSVAIGPIIGAAAAALIAGDPRGIIWGRQNPAAAMPAAVPPTGEIEPNPA
jgi:hypothetical protein